MNKKPEAIPKKWIEAYMKGYARGLQDGGKQDKQQGKLEELDVLDKWTFGFHSEKSIGQLLDALRKRNQNRRNWLKSKLKEDKV